MIGYVFQNYVNIVPEVQIEKINILAEKTVLEKGETIKLQVEILPSNANETELEYNSSNSDVAIVDNNGNIIALKSGTTTITVQVKSNNIKAEIQITVYTPVTDIEIINKNIIIPKGENFTITPIIVPEDADNKNVKYLSENEQIASIDTNGNIIAIKEGIAKIIIITEDGNLKKEIQVTISKQISENDIVFDDSLNIYQTEITGWNIDELDITSIKKQIQTIYNVKIYDYKENELIEGQNIGTGSSIKFINENNITVMEYSIIIYGDVNGDGKINSLDLLVLQRHILEVEKLKGVFFKARQYK